MQTLRPAEGIYAFYEGRGEGEAYGAEPNWLDENVELGIASYAVVDGGQALIYDTHVSVDRAQGIRDELEAAGVGEFTVLLSHWHLDHIAGTAAFADCEVIATARTAELMAEHREAIESATYEGPPAIKPLVMPTRTFDDRLSLEIGATRCEVLHLNIHSDDAGVLWLPDRGILLAGDTLEDTVTYVDRPQDFAAHLHDLGRLADLAPDRILPAHGDPGVIERGGYPAGFIEATRAYISVLLRVVDEPELRDAPLAQLIADSLAAGWLAYHEPYEALHRQNVERVLAAHC